MEKGRLLDDLLQENSNFPMAIFKICQQKWSACLLFGLDSAGMVKVVSRLYHWVVQRKATRWRQPRRAMAVHGGDFIHSHDSWDTQYDHDYEFLWEFSWILFHGLVP